MTERGKDGTFTTAFKERAVKRLRKGEGVLGLHAPVAVELGGDSPAFATISCNCPR